MYIFLYGVFLHGVLILPPKWSQSVFVSEVGRHRGARIPISGKKSQQHIFQGTMATEHSKEFWWEQQGKRGWWQGRQFVTPIARATEPDCTRKHCAIVLIWTIVQKHCSPLLSCNKSRLRHLDFSGDGRLSPGRCWEKESVAAKCWHSSRRCV